MEFWITSVAAGTRDKSIIKYKGKEIVVDFFLSLVQMELLSVGADLGGQIISVIAVLTQ